MDHAWYDCNSCASVQVRVERIIEAKPLGEDVFKSILKDNYYGPYNKYLSFELTGAQVLSLVKAFVQHDDQTSVDRKRKALQAELEGLRRDFTSRFVSTLFP